MDSGSTTDKLVVDFSGSRKQRSPVPYVIDIQNSFNGHQRDACSTPLRLYVQRSWQSRVTTPLLHTRSRWNPQDQVSLSQLTLDRFSFPAERGFQSTTRVKCAPVPVAYNQHPYTPRNTRKIVATTDRYNPLLTPVPQDAVYHSRQRRKPKQVISWKPELPSPRLNHQERALALNKSRYLMSSRESLPHRLSHNFYMRSKCIKLEEREIVPPANVLNLPSLDGPLSHKRSLFYGTGIKPVNGGAPRKALQRFVEKFHSENSATTKRFGSKKEDVDISDNGSTSESFLSQLDVGRYSRLSRAMTPGSPILEEIDEEEAT